MAYNKDSISLMSDLDHIRLRSGMYIGDSNDPRQLLSEIFDNAIDEVQNGYSKEMLVTVDTKSNTYSVRDYGRGIPHGKKILDNGDELEILEILSTRSNSGGKFDNDSYNYSSGLHGVGLTVTNALSTNLCISSYRDGIEYSIKNVNQNIESIEYKDSSEHNGTLVSFSPDKEMFRNSIIPKKFIEHKCRISSALGFRARLIVDNEEINTDFNIYELIEDEENISTYHKFEEFDIISDTQERMKTAVWYTSDTNDRYSGYTNLLYNPSGGTHITEISRAIINTWKEVIDSNKIKLDVDLRNNDYLIGMRVVCAVFISSPSFSSQTKEKLVVNKNDLKELMELFKSDFKDVLNSDMKLTRSLIKRFEEYRLAQNKLLSRKEIADIIKMNSDNPDNIRRRSIVSKLVECTSKSKKDTELIIVEGDSAASPFKITRDKKTQAILPLRGKILNITNKDVMDAIKNSEICDIANSIGCGIGSKCDASKSRYERVIISCDADSDGKQISSLVISVFVNMFPDIVKEGMLYLALPPLYVWNNGKYKYNWSNELSEIPDNINMSKVHRMKGLGEMNNDQLYHFLVNKETRNLIRVDYPSDITKFNRILGTSIGKSDLMRDTGLII